MADKRCDDTGLLVAQCACKLHAPAPVREPIGVSAVFTARWDGQCGECGASFEEGERVGFDTEDTLICGECIDKLEA